MNVLKMTNGQPVALAVAAVLSLGGACTSSSSVPIDQITARYATAICSHFASCPAQGESAFVGVLARHPGSVATCESLFAGDGGGNLDALEAAVVSGTVRYDGDAAERCLDAISGQCAPFDVIVATDANCLSVFQGTVAAGGACTLDEQCSGASHCELPPGGSCAGTCVASVGVGAACSSSKDCADDLGGGMSCTTTPLNPSSHCVLTRVSGAGPGAPCGNLDADGDERSSVYCTGGAFCKLSAGVQIGTCALPIAVGAACDRDFDVCAADATCAGTPGATTCRAITVVNQANAGCNDAALVMCNQLSRLICESSVCVSIGDGTLGADCRTDINSDCNSGFYCEDAPSSSLGTCQTKIANGSPCDQSRGCVSGYCDFSTTPGTPTCAAPACGN